MNMNWIQSLIYGLVSGLSEFLPISSHGHQSLLIQLFGMDTRDPIRDLVVHLSLLLALYTGCRTIIEQLRREQNLKVHNRRNHRTTHGVLELRLIKNAAIPMLIGMLLLSYGRKTDINLLTLSLFFLINGIILFIPSRMMQGNKDARTMSGLDSLITGCAAAFSALSGISRIATTTSVTLARGADRQKALTWALLLSIPALIALLGIDLIHIVSQFGQIHFWANFLGYFLSGVTAFCGGIIGIDFIKFLTVRTGYTAFAYYSWGAALLSFLLYLTVV